MKYIIALIQTLALVLYNLIFGDPVTATVKTPETISAGQPFTIEVTISKAQVSGFAKLQLELPPGYTATEGDSKGGNFSTSGNIVKVIWTSIPADAAITLKMNVTAPNTIGSNNQLTGKFSYIENNAKQQVEITAVSLNVGGTAAAADPVATQETTPADNSNAQNSQPPVTNANTTAPTSDTASDAASFSKPAEPDASIAVRRQVTASGSANNFEITLTLQKGAISGFAKLSEKVPEGFVASEVSAAGSSFAFENGVVKFIWASLPSAEQVMVSYKLSPDANGGIQNPSVIEGGTFSYIENNQTKKQALQSESLTTTPTKKAPAEVAATTTEKKSGTTKKGKTTSASTAAETPAKQETAAQQETTTQATTPASGNLHYSVQIGAFKNGVSAGALKQKYGIRETVRSEMIDGFTKCIYGKYSEYKVARDSRETARGKGVEGAFVTAYNSGKRITVQEALMVSNQKWYK
ncbi:MAG: hypothetical protein JST67_06315 [Bacteroidetes bacterium]|nr:hypothetical protein [Bacteroidota bacterium]